MLVSYVLKTLVKICLNNNLLDADFFTKISIDLDPNCNTENIKTTE